MSTVPPPPPPTSAPPASAGPQLQALDRSGPRRTSTASTSIAQAMLGPRKNEWFMGRKISDRAIYNQQYLYIYIYYSYIDLYLHVCIHTIIYILVCKTRNSCKKHIELKKLDVYLLFEFGYVYTYAVSGFILFICK